MHAAQRDHAPSSSLQRSGYALPGCRRVATSSPALTPQQVPRETKRRRLGTPSASDSPLQTNGIHVDLTSSEAEGTLPVPHSRLHVRVLKVVCRCRSTLRISHETVRA